jgi:hypothetical protein
MQNGDLVILKNLAPDWGKVAFVTKVYVTSCGTGQISLFAKGGMRCTIPWHKRDKYISEVISESR